MFLIVIVEGLASRPKFSVSAPGLMQCWPSSTKGCPRGLVISHRFEITSFASLSSLIENSIVACFVIFY